MHTRQLAGMRDMRVQHDRGNPSEMIDRRLWHRRAGIGADYESRIGIATNQHVDRRELAGVITRIAAVKRDPERIARLPPHDDIGTGDVAVTAHRHGNEFGEGIHLGGQCEQCGGVHVLAARHRNPHAEEHTTEFRLLHSLDQVVQRFERQSRLGDGFLTDLLVLNQRAQDRNQFEVFTGANLEEDVGGLRALCGADIHEHHRSVFTSPGQELTLGHQRVLRKVSGVALRGIASPVHNKISSVLHFTECTSDFATQLGGDFRGTVSQRGVAIEQTAKHVCHRHTLPLSFARGIAHAIDQRHVGLVQVRRGDFDGFVERRFFAIDQGIRVLTFDGVVQEPSRPQHASLFRCVNADFVGVQFDIVTHAAAECTRRIVNDCQRHNVSRVCRPNTLASVGSLKAWAVKTLQITRG